MKRVTLWLVLCLVSPLSAADRSADDTASPPAKAEEPQQQEFTDLQRVIDELLSALEQALGQLQTGGNDALSSLEQGLKAAEQAGKPLLEQAEKGAQVFIEQLKENTEQFLDELEQQLSEEMEESLPNEAPAPIDNDMNYQQQA